MTNQTTDILKSYSNLPLDVQQILTVFANDIFSNPFFNNLPVLKANSSLVPFNQGSWYMRPHVFCLDQYDQQYYFPVILLLNNISSIYNFTPNNFENNQILAPTVNSIQNVLGYATTGSS